MDGHLDHQMAVPLSDALLQFSSWPCSTEGALWVCMYVCPSNHKISWYLLCQRVFELVFTQINNLQIWFSHYPRGVGEEHVLLPLRPLTLKLRAWLWFFFCGNCISLLTVCIYLQEETTKNPCHVLYMGVSKLISCITRCKNLTQSIYQSHLVLSFRRIHKQPISCQWHMSHIADAMQMGQQTLPCQSVSLWYRSNCEANHAQL